ncbi:Vegetative incompatibility protein HET-E-1 [Ceratocystis lukuohia]|uniref:Vegetative incompatibility protein HET-E-1 n=1 Tax=Ceratocystis lukuohia TaxID=2019550 RepID=A0ABR4MJ80_9PEZI
MPPLFHRAKAKAQKLFKSSIQSSIPATPSAATLFGPVQTASGPPSSVVHEPEPALLPLPRLQGEIWNQAYDASRKEEPELVEAFENIVFAKLRPKETSTEAASRFEGNMAAERMVTSRQLQQLVQDGINRTKKEASIKQRIDDGMQAVHAIRGIMDRVIRAAPEAAVVWATVCLGIEVLSNPVTEALENRKGLEDKTSTAAMQNELKKDIVRLFQRLLLYQMRSICLYHRNSAAIILRDLLRVDNWADQLNTIREAEEAVQYHMEQYNTQESKMQLQKLNDAAGSLQQDLQSINAAVQDQTEQQANRHQDDKDKQCLLDLHVTDPYTDKKNIEEKKGGLLKDSYKWILEHAGFQQFRNEQQCRILWIKGDPGKGKTMLLCGIIDELESDPSVPLSYFFCQATGGDRLDKATSVLRGLIYHLACRNPQLTKHVRTKYDYKGRDLFNNDGAWHILCEIMTAMLNDPGLENAILVVDALDECSVDRQRLLDFITKPSPAKWIVSSRNWLDIEESLDDAEQKVKLQLELNQSSVSSAVESYVTFKVNQLAKKKKYDDDMRVAVLEHLRANAEGTFLWVALVCQELSNVTIRKRHTPDILKSFPPGLDPLYGRMLEQITQSKDAGLCREILATALVAYRPVTLEELHALVEPLRDLESNEVKEVISSCGSFLTLHGNHVSFVHQSAKDYLLSKASNEILPRGIAYQHQTVFKRSLDLLCTTLERDIYNLQAPGYLANQVSAPDPDPLATIQYSCIFWIDHFLSLTADELASGIDKVSSFFKNKYLQWLEALSLLHSISTGVRAMERMEAFVQENEWKSLQEVVKDAHRFLLSHGGIIEIAPLQVYASALIFSPTKSLIRQLFSREEPDWINLKPRVETNWNACLQTFEGHCDGVTSVVFSKDEQRLASGSCDKTIKIWDAASGTCLQTLEGHGDSVRSVAFSNNGQRLASGSDDSTIKIWDAASGACLQTLKGHSDGVRSVAFSRNGQRLVSGSDDNTVKIWDATSGACLQILDDHYGRVKSVVFSDNGKRVASGSNDKTVKIWDAASGACLHVLHGHSDWIRSVVFSQDGQRLASGSDDKTVKIWDATSGACLKTFKGHKTFALCVAFSKNGQQLASGSDDKTVKIWDTTSGACLQTLEGHGDSVRSIAFLKDGQRLASGSDDKTVKIWDATSGACLQTLDAHDSWVWSVAFSQDEQLLASASNDSTIRTWDTASGICSQTFNGHDGWVRSVVFSQDGQRLASGSDDKTVKVWDATSSTCLQTLIGHNGWVRFVVFSKDGQRLASGSNDRTIRIWDPTSGACLQILNGHDGLARSAVFSQDGQQLASGASGNAVKIWDVASGACLKVLEGHNDPVVSVAFSKGDQRLASGSSDRTVRVWDAASGACLKILSMDYTIQCYVPTSAAIPSVDHTSLSGSNLRGYGLDNDGVWIMNCGQRVLWLPPEWRFVRSAVTVKGTKIALGCISGRVFVIGFTTEGYCE